MSTNILKLIPLNSPFYFVGILNYGDWLNNMSNLCISKTNFSSAFPKFSPNPT